MRTAGMLLMDTPLPDGRIVVLPQDFIGATVSTPSTGLSTIVLTGAAVGYQGFPSGVLLRYGMSDDAQQQFGKASPSGGYQGAQAQAVSTLTPFTSPYGPSGRPPQVSASQFLQPNARPKGLKPTAVTTVYSVTVAGLTSFQVSLNKAVFNVGLAPTVTTVLAGTNLPLQVATTQIITTPIPVANQVWFADPFDIMSVSLNINPAAGTATIYGVFIDVAFNYN